MRVFVTGANGFIGTAVIKRLIQNGHTVTGLVRSDEASRDLITLGAVPVRGELHQRDVLSEAALAADGVIHLGFGGPDAVPTDRLSVQTFLDALADSEKPFVYTSGVTVVGDTGTHVFDESAPLVAGLPVSWRGVHEQLARSGATRGLRPSVVRPTLVYGAGRPRMARVFYDQLRDGEAPRFVGSGEFRWSTVYVEDLADLYVRALEHAPAGEIYNGAGDETVQFRALAEAVNQSEGHVGQVESLPPEEAVRLGLVAQLMLMNAQVSGHKARTTLGWQPSGPTLLSMIESGRFTARE